MLATIGLTGDPMAAHFSLFKELILKQEIGVIQTEPQQLNNVVS